MHLLVRNRVRDFAHWYSYLEADIPVAKEYGLALESVWQSADDPNNVFFLLSVQDRSRADAFMARPESQEIGTKSGVLDGEFHYLNLTNPDS